MSLVVAVLAPCTLTYGSEHQQLENIAPESAEEEHQQDQDHEAANVVNLVEEVDDDTADVDVENSIDIDVDKKGSWLRADLRAGFFALSADLRDGSSISADEFKIRGRIEADVALGDNLRFMSRVAGTCSTEECDLDVSLQPTTSNANSMANGEITVDEAFLHHFRPRYDIAVGRLQTKFVARGGVFAKSLDRNDSNNVRINWTDGLHATWKSRFGWTSHLILQRNDSEGSSSVRRSPLDFQAGDSRVTYFVAMENVKPWGPIVQRGLDVSYLPSSLLKDGTSQGPIEDYWGVVGRFAARWTVSEKRDMRFRVSGGIGYAPETPTKQAMGTGNSGESDGLGWAVTAALMDFRPGHSIGFNYGRMGAGWLLSPQYRQNEELSEVRYVWRYRDNKTIEIKVRHRNELDQLVTAQHKRDELDVFVRMTSGFTLVER
jgi:hypothetical protein